MSRSFAFHRLWQEFRPTDNIDDTAGIQCCHLDQQDVLSSAQVVKYFQADLQLHFTNGFDPLCNSSFHLECQRVKRESGRRSTDREIMRAGALNKTWTSVFSFGVKLIGGGDDCCRRDFFFLQARREPGRL